MTERFVHGDSRRTRVLIWAVSALCLWFCCACASRIQQAERRYEAGDKIQSLELYEAALKEIRPDHSDYDSTRQRIFHIRAEITDGVLSKIPPLSDEPNLPDVRAAVVLLKDHLPYDDEQRRMEQALSLYLDREKTLESSLDRDLGESQRAASREDWNRAVGALDRALTLSPGEPDLLSRRSALLQERDTAFRNRLDEAIGRKDWKQAKEVFDELTCQQPASDTALVSAYRDRVDALVEGGVLKELRNLSREKRYFAALRLVEDSPLASQESLLAGIRSSGSAYYMEEAKRIGAEEPDKLGLAYLLSVKSLMLNPDHEGAFAVHRELRDRLERKIRVQIAVSGFGSPVDQPNVGVQFSDDLISYLVQRLPYGIEVLERSKIDLLLKESGKELKQLSEVLGAHLFIIGNVNVFDTEHQRSENRSRVVVPMGERVEPNPLYDQMLKTYGTDMSKWPSIPEKTIRVPLSSMTTYVLGKERIKAVMNVSLRIFDSEKASITVAKSFRAAEDAEDAFSDAVPAAGIRHDPLELPTDGEIRQLLMEKMVAKVAGVVLSAFEARERRFWERAAARMDRREHDEAVEELAKGFLYCRRAGIGEENPWFTKIKDAALFQLTE